MLLTSSRCTLSEYALELFLQSQEHRFSRLKITAQVLPQSAKVEGQGEGIWED